MHAIIRVKLPTVNNLKIKHVIGCVREDDKEICYSLRVETIKIIRGANAASKKRVANKTG